MKLLNEVKMLPLNILIIFLTLLALLMLGHSLGATGGSRWSVFYFRTLSALVVNFKKSKSNLSKHFSYSFSAPSLQASGKGDILDILTGAEKNRYYTTTTHHNLYFIFTSATS